MSDQRRSQIYRTHLSLASALLCAACASTGSRSAGHDMEVVPDVVLAIHGGAGTILRENMSPEMDLAYRSALTEALEADAHALLAHLPQLGVDFL